MERITKKKFTEILSGAKSIYFRFIDGNDNEFIVKLMDTAQIPVDLEWETVQSACNKYIWFIGDCGGYKMFLTKDGKREYYIHGKFLVQKVIYDYYGKKVNQYDIRLIK